MPTGPAAGDSLPVNLSEIMIQVRLSEFTVTQARSAQASASGSASTGSGLLVIPLAIIIIMTRMPRAGPVFHGTGNLNFKLLRHTTSSMCQY